MIDLYTASTPNGWKASICLEEMGLPYQVNFLNLAEGDQKKEDYQQINPNGRIPAIVDRDHDDSAVFESGAILLYLAEKTGRLFPTEAKARSVAMQWLMFQMSGIGPMQGQALVFKRNAPEKIPFAIDRYMNETARLYGVLDQRLSQLEYIAGKDYGIVDIANWTWVYCAAWTGIDMARFPHLSRWAEAVGSRPAVIRGLNVPEKMDLTALAMDPEKVADVEQKWSRLMQR